MYSNKFKILQNIGKEINYFRGNRHIKTNFSIKHIIPHKTKKVNMLTLSAFYPYALRGAKQITTKQGNY